MIFLTCTFALSVNASAIRSVLLPLGCAAGGRRLLPLLLVVLERSLDGVLGQDGAMDLDRRQLELAHDVRVLDLGRLVYCPPLEPLRGQARRRDRAAATERLELGVLDDPGLEVDLDLELHDVAALGRAHEPRPHARRVLGEGPDVARVVVVVHYLVAVSHVSLCLLAPERRPYSPFHWMVLRSTPSLASSYRGDISRRRCTTSTTRRPTKSTSSSVEKRCSPKRIDEWASSESTPRAAITYEGSRVEEVHADPEERADSLLSPISTDSPST